MKVSVDSLIKIGGSEWISGERHRVYFNKVEELYGLRCSLYKTGNISSAKFRGEIISNSKAAQIRSMFSDVKFYYDVKAQSFAGTRYLIDRVVDIGNELIEELVREVESKLSE